MNFAFTEEQEELRKTVRAFLDAKSPESAVREQMETVAGVDPVVWNQMGEQMGLQGLQPFQRNLVVLDLLRLSLE